MSLENSLERIADALEKLIEQNDNPIKRLVIKPKTAKDLKALEDLKKNYGYIELPDNTDPDAIAPDYIEMVKRQKAAFINSTVKSSNGEGIHNPSLAEEMKKNTPIPPVKSSMTVEELNEALVNEFNRIGSREPIDKVLREQYEVASITDLKEEQYQGLIDAVKAL